MLTQLENDNVKDIYEQIAPQFNNTRQYRWSWVNEFLNTLEDNSIVLDLGCGNGRNMQHNNLNFIGIDNCKNFIDICKEKNLNVINSNILTIPLQEQIADAIICIAVFHHLSTEENRLNALLEMKRLIKPNGKILLSVWSFEQPKKINRTFNEYGNNIVLWNNNQGKIYERYYYIFKIDEILELFKLAKLNVISHEYSVGNEIFVLECE